MRHGSSGCSATGATTLPVSPRSCSTRARRSTWRDWRSRTRTGSHGHARWCARGRVAQRWKACAARPMPFQLSAADRVTSVARHRVGTALIPPDDAHRLDRLAGRDQSVQRQLAGAGLTARRHDFDAATLVVRATDVALALEVREVLVHGGERAERETLRDLLEARGVSLGGDLPRDEIENLALTAGERHAFSRTETEG